MEELTITDNDFDRDELQNVRSVEFTGTGQIRVEERDFRSVKDVTVSGQIDLSVRGSIRANVRVTDAARLNVSADVAGDLCAEKHAIVDVSERVSGRKTIADTADVTISKQDMDEHHVPGYGR